jgi:hypothetical protein
MFPNLETVKAIMCVYKSTKGNIGFETDELGQKLLNSIISDDCVITSDGKLVNFDNNKDVDKFLPVVHANNKMSISSPDKVVVEEVGKLNTYLVKDKINKLKFRKTGKKEDILAPLLNSLFLDDFELKEKCMSWLLSHVENIVFWDRFTEYGTQLTVLSNNKLLEESLAQLCRQMQVSCEFVSKAEELPCW